MRIKILGLQVAGSQGGIEKKTVPGGIEIEPPLRAEPARRELRDVQQAMAASADKFSSVPREKVTRRFANARGMGQFAETHGASLPLIAQDPAQAEEAGDERYDELDILSPHSVDEGNELSKIQGSSRDEDEQQGDLPHKEGPSPNACRPGKIV